MITPKNFLESMDITKQLYFTQGFGNTASDEQLVDMFKIENSYKYAIRHRDCALVFIPIVVYGQHVVTPVNMDNKDICPIISTPNDKESAYTPYPYTNRLDSYYNNFDEFIDTFKHLEVLLSKEANSAVELKVCSWMINSDKLLDREDLHITTMTTIRELELNYNINKSKHMGCCGCRG